MRREYDFSQGTIGNHTGRRFRIAGDRSNPRQEIASKIQRIIELDLKSHPSIQDPLHLSCPFSFVVLLLWAASPVVALRLTGQLSPEAQAGPRRFWVAAVK